MSEMVERVARAIEEAGSYVVSADGGRDGYRKRVARAAIQAMREPSDAMVQKIWDEAGVSWWKENAVKAWQAGIDEALK